MGPVKVFVLLAAISSVLGSDESLNLKPWIPKFLKPAAFRKHPTNESWENFGTIDPVKFIREKNALDCGSYNLSPGQSVDIHSTKLQQNYLKNNKCTWTFAASSPNSTLSINCNPFKLKNCKITSLKITGGNLDKIFCGNLTEVIEASSSDKKMEVVFKRKKITSGGFQCTVSASGTTQETRSCVQCGTVNRVNRILYGEQTDVNEYPWQVALVLPDKNDVFCGGVIYNDYFIMTAAHCLVKAYSWRILPDVLLGAHALFNPTSNQQRIRAYGYDWDRRFNSVTYDNDFGILWLTTPATFNAFVKPACLPNPLNDYAYSNAVASGWGKTEVSLGSSVLLEANLKILKNNYECSYYHYMTWNMLCAIGVPQTNWQTTCRGDSGGPLVVLENGRWVVVGLTSSGRPSCPTYIPTVFTRVSRYLDTLITLPNSGQYTLC